MKTSRLVASQHKTMDGLTQYQPHLSYPHICNTIIPPANFATISFYQIFDGVLLDQRECNCLFNHCDKFAWFCLIKFFFEIFTMCTLVVNWFIHKSHVLASAFKIFPQKYRPSIV
jgi:hypothetical protein